MIRKVLLLSMILAASDGVPKQLDFVGAMRKGTYLARIGNYKGALKYFKIAVRLEPRNPNPYYNVGVVAKQINDCRSMMLYFAGYLYLARTQGLSDTKEAEAGIRSCSRQGAGTVNITGPKGGIEVYIDGALVGVTPVKELKLMPGRYHLEVNDEYFLPYSQDFEVPKGEEVSINLQLIARTFYGFLTVETEPVKKGVEVYVDGKLVGKTPLKKYKLVTGSHLVTLKAKGYDEWKRYVDIQRDMEFTLEATLYRPNYGQLNKKGKRIKVPPQYEKLWKEFETK